MKVDHCNCGYTCLLVLLMHKADLLCSLFKLAASFQLGCPSLFGLPRGLHRFVMDAVPFDRDNLGLECLIQAFTTKK